MEIGSVTYLSSSLTTEVGRRNVGGVRAKAMATTARKPTESRARGGRKRRTRSAEEEQETAGRERGRGKGRKGVSEEERR